MAPMKLYGMPLSPNVVRVAAALNEKGLDFEIVPVDLRTGAHKQPEFLALNVRIHYQPFLAVRCQPTRSDLISSSPCRTQPFGQIPALQDGDDVLYGKYSSRELSFPQTVENARDPVTRSLVALVVVVVVVESLCISL
jgi:hypothetical protein